MMPDKKKLFVFDLDFTLWNAGGTWCDCTSPPFRRINGHVADRNGLKIMLYPEVLEIISELKLNNKLLAIASRTEEPGWAMEILDLLDIRKIFDFEEIFPDRKTNHLMKIQKQSGLMFSEMVFFDDEHRNIEDVSRMGVESEWVRNGITRSIVFRHLNYR